MRRAIRARITYANVVATLALFVALGGTSYAVKQLGSKDIRDNSIRSKDIRNRTLLRKDFKRGQIPRRGRGPRGFRGARGLRGKTGRTGRTGRTGKRGLSGISGLTVVGADTASNSSDKSGTATCPSGRRAVGGGAILKSGPPTAVALASSGPSGNPPTGWRTSALEVNGGTLDPWQLTVYAVCARVSG